MPEALDEIRGLKTQMVYREHHNEELLAELNRVQEALEDALEENDALRDETGLKNGQQVDRAKFKSRMYKEMESLKSLRTQLEVEIERLESELLHWKQQARFQALQRGERAAQLGLTIEQVVKLDQLAESMRRGEGAAFFQHLCF